MTKNIEFIERFKSEFAESPSPSEADNSLADDIVLQIDNGDNDPQTLKRCLLAWQTKKLPRYLINSDGNTQSDDISGRWSPGFYRMDASLNYLQKKLDNADVLDVFAGSGSMMHTLLAFDIPRSVTLNDICYIGGSVPLKDDLYYSPKDNLREYEKIFDKYRDFIPRPKFNKVTKYLAEDVKRGLNADSKSFDYVFTDPPYGKALKSGGYKELLSCLPEILRVSREGALLILPESWIPEIKNSGKCKIDDLTLPLNHKGTTFRTSLTHIY